MQRREFVKLIAGTAAGWPLPAGAQQPKPVIGYLGATSRNKDTSMLASFHAGLKELGFTEGQNVTIEHRWAEGRYDQLPALAAELVRQQVAVMFTPASTPAAKAAKAASQTIPIVFTIGADPVATGLVTSASCR
jgi:putative ABC transport system substrate-binding protein